MTLVPRIPYYPVLVAGAMVLAVFVDTDVYIAVLWRPMVIAVGCTIIFQAVLTLVLRHPHRAAIVTAVSPRRMVPPSVLTSALRGLLRASVNG